jgi:hypothetical protein
MPIEAFILLSIEVGKIKEVVDLPQLSAPITGITKDAPKSILFLK